MLLDDVLQKWPELVGRSALEWAMFAQILNSKGEKQAAAQVLRATCERPDADPQACTIARESLQVLIPEYHEVILRDLTRNRLYDEALKHCIKPGDYVLDIGTGSGLLAMMAARAGAKRVYACEMNPASAALAERVFAANGLADRITVLPKHSGKLIPGQDIERPVDLIVSEIISNNLFSEDVLETHRDAVARLLRTDGAIIPPKITVMAALGYTPEAADTFMKNVSGFDLSAFQMGHPRWRIKAGNTQTHLCSRAVPLFSFDLATPGTWPEVQINQEVQAESPDANCILSWIRLDMDGSGKPEMRYENRPGTMEESCWAVLAWSIQPPTPHMGSTVRISARYVSRDLFVWQDLI